MQDVSMFDNWDDLRIFLAVARQSSLTAAGRDLRLDPATMGRRVARLESQLSTALFRKSPRGYALTDVGAELLVRAEAAEEAMRAATASVAAQERSNATGLRGQIRLGAPDGAANYLLPQVCKAIVEEHPDLDIQIVALPRVFNLTRREADLAIGVSAPDEGRLLVQRITDYKLHFAASETYLETHPKIHHLSDLQEHRLIGYIPDMIFDAELDYLANLDVDRVPLTSNSVAVQARMLTHGGGVGVTHDFALPSLPGVRRILTDEFSLTRSFYLVRHSADQNDARLSRFATRLGEGVRAEVAQLETQA